MELVGEGPGVGGRRHARRRIAARFRALARPLDVALPSGNNLAAMDAPETQALDPYVFGSEQKCFGCGPHNDKGLRLRFTREGDEVVTRFTPTEGLEGPPGVFHGGLQATLADEVAGWTLVGVLGRMGFTTSMNVRYVRPVRIDQEVEARGRVQKRSGNIATVSVVLKQAGEVGLMGRVSYMLPDPDKAGAYLGGNLPPDWLHLFENPAVTPDGD